MPNEMELMFVVKKLFTACPLCAMLCVIHLNSQQFFKILFPFYTRNRLREGKSTCLKSDFKQQSQALNRELLTPNLVLYVLLYSKAAWQLVKLSYLKGQY